MPLTPTPAEVAALTATPAERIAALYQQHARNPGLRMLLAEYAACITQLERSAMALAVLGETKLAEAINARARDLMIQAERCARQKETHGTDDERTTRLVTRPK